MPGLTQERVVQITDAPIELGFVAAPTTYTPFYKQGDAEVHLEELSNKVVCRNKIWDSPFTGAHFGLFAQGIDGESSLVPAHFGRTSFIPQ